MNLDRNKISVSPWVKSWGRIILLTAVLVLPLQALWAAGPSLSLGNGSGPAGGIVTLPLRFDPGKASISAVQFDLILPASLSTGTVTSGEILNTAGKNVSTVRTGKAWKFIIAGLNQEIIPAGTLLTLQLKIASSKTSGSLKVAVSGIVYSDPHGNSIPPGTRKGGTVTVAP